MGYTLEQLQQMGATPTQKKSYTLEELQSLGAKPVDSQIDLPEPVMQKKTTNPFVEFGKGFAKGAAETISSAGAHRAGPVGAAMSANAPEFMKAVSSFDTAMEAKNTAQLVGKGAEFVGEMFIPVTGAKKVYDTRKIATAPKKLMEELAPRLVPTKYAGVAKLGQTSPRTLFKGARISPEDFPAAKEGMSAVLDVASDLGKKPWSIVKPGGSPTKNVNNLVGTISEYSNSVISPFLKSNRVSTNFDDFIRYMDGVKPSQALQSSPDSLETFNRIRNRVVQTVYNSMTASARKANDFGAMTDMNDYWHARKVIDDIIDEEMGAKVFTDPGVSTIKNAASSLRAGVADFISDTLRFPGQGELLATYRQTINGMRDNGMNITPQELKALARQLGLQPTGEIAAKRWDKLMKNTSGLYKSIDMLSTKVNAEQKAGKIGQVVKDNPFLVKAAKVAGYGLLGGATGAAGFKILSGE